MKTYINNCKLTLDDLITSDKIFYYKISKICL